MATKEEANGNSQHDSVVGTATALRGRPPRSTARAPLFVENAPIIHTPIHTLLPAAGEEKIGATNVPG